MSYKKYLRPLLAVLVMASMLLGSRMTVFAQTSSSSNYRTREYYFGTGGEVDMNSTNFRSRGSAGSLGVGESSSANFIGQSGFVTAEEEYLEMVVNAATIDLGTLSTSAASTGTATFYVRAYTSSGYYVQSVSETPTNDSENLDAMAVSAASTPGTEQFGMNLVANTLPSTFGANPVAIPSAGYAFGVAASGYNVANEFRYNQGDTIATSPRGIGQTDFTISYVANVSPVTPGGQYTVDHILVLVASY